MIRDLSNPFEREQFMAYVQGRIQKGMECEAEHRPYPVEIKVKRQGRTLSQNAYLHVLIGFFALEYGCTADEVKVDFYKRKCNKDLYERKKIAKNGQEIVTLRSSSELSTEDMALSITRFRNWASAEAGIYLPSADEYNYISYCQQQIENNKEYL